MAQLLFAHDKLEWGSGKHIHLVVKVCLINLLPVEFLSHNGNLLLVPGMLRFFPSPLSIPYYLKYRFSKTNFHLGHLLLKSQLLLKSSYVLSAVLNWCLHKSTNKKKGEVESSREKMASVV